MRGCLRSQTGEYYNWHQGLRFSNRAVFGAQPHAHKQISTSNISPPSRFWSWSHVTMLHLKLKLWWRWVSTASWYIPGGDNTRDMKRFSPTTFLNIRVNLCRLVHQKWCSDIPVHTYWHMVAWVHSELTQLSHWLARWLTMEDVRLSHGCPVIRLVSAVYHPWPNLHAMVWN